MCTGTIIIIYTSTSVQNNAKEGQRLTTCLVYIYYMNWSSIGSLDVQRLLAGRSHSDLEATEREVELIVEDVDMEVHIRQARLDRLGGVAADPRLLRCRGLIGRGDSGCLRFLVLNMARTNDALHIVFVSRLAEQLRGAISLVHSLSRILGLPASTGFLRLLEGCQSRCDMRRLHVLGSSSNRYIILQLLDVKIYGFVVRIRHAGSYLWKDTQ